MLKSILANIKPHDESGITTKHIKSELSYGKGAEAYRLIGLYFSDGAKGVVSHIENLHSALRVPK